MDCFLYDNGLRHERVKQKDGLMKKASEFNYIFLFQLKTLY